MSDLVDQARPLRDEDAFDVGAVAAFLESNVEGLHDTPKVAQFAGGASNLTYLLNYPHRELVLRRAPSGAKAASAHDMLREARVMRSLKPHYPYVPDVVAICDDAEVIGQPFFVMERLRGIILRQNIPSALGLDAAATRQLCLGFLDRLVDLHSIDATAPDLAHVGRGEGYIARQVAGWTRRWEGAATEGVDPCEDVTAWLSGKQPRSDNAACVVHNDFRFDNIVLDPKDPQRIIGVLDWEMATIGDPLMDFGGSLAYWVQADDEASFLALRRQPTNAPGMLTRNEAVVYYGERTGTDVSGMDFYEVFGLFRLMVIAQQIYRRFALGQTTNPQFASFGEGVRYLGGRCRRIIDRSPL